MKKILILFSLIGCLSFAEEFKCKGNKDKDISYLITFSEKYFKEVYVGMSINDKTLLKKAKKENEQALKIIDHLLKKHMNSLTLQETKDLVESKKTAESIGESLSDMI